MGTRVSIKTNKKVGGLIKVRKIAITHPGKGTIRRKFVLTVSGQVGKLFKSSSDTAFAKSDAGYANNLSIKKLLTVAWPDDKILKLR